jgi:hypothetical protein
MTDIRMAKGYRALTVVTEDSDPISYADIEERIPWRCKASSSKRRP